MTYDYYFNGPLYADWIIDKKYPVELIVSEEDSRNITIKWLSNYSGQFDISYGTFTKTIVVESLF